MKKVYKKIKLKRCELCQSEKFPLGRQRYCGSYKRKQGCSWIMKKKNDKKWRRIWWEKNGESYNKTPHRKKYLKEYEQRPHRKNRPSHRYRIKTL